MSAVEDTTAFASAAAPEPPKALRTRRALDRADCVQSRDVWCRWTLLKQDIVLEARPTRRNSLQDRPTALNAKRARSPAARPTPSQSCPVRGRDGAGGRSLVALIAHFSLASGLAVPLPAEAGSREARRGQEPPPRPFSLRRARGCSAFDEDPRSKQHHGTAAGYAKRASFERVSGAVTTQLHRSRASRQRTLKTSQCT